jgi:hypothetical protein
MATPRSQSTVTYDLFEDSSAALCECCQARGVRCRLIVGRITAAQER